MTQIKGFPGYWISRNGKVWSSYYGKWLIATFNTKGYLQVTLCLNHRHYNKTIHHLVLETYVGIKPKGMEGCHNDGNKHRNCLTNLRWDTQESNVADSVRLGTHLRHRTGSEYRCWTTKLTWDIVDHIRSKYVKGFITHKQLADQFGVTKATITSLLNHKT
jgi:hypothetical protein